MKRIIDVCARAVIKHTFIGPYVRHIGLKSIKKELILARRHLAAVKKTKSICRKKRLNQIGFGIGQQNTGRLDRRRLVCTGSRFTS